MSQDQLLSEIQRLGAMVLALGESNEKLQQSIINQNNTISGLQNAAKEQGTKITALAKAPPLHPIHPAHKPSGPKLAMPSRYHGDRASLRTFLCQCELIVELQPERFPNDDMKIGFIGSYLEGPAASWFAAVKSTDVCKSFVHFVGQFKGNFGDRELAENAAISLSSLTQGRSSINEYASKFRVIASDVKWNEEALMHQFVKGLNSDLQRGVAYQGKKFKSLSKMISKVINMGNQLTSTQSRYVPQSSSTPPATSAEPMDIGAMQGVKRGPITPQERQRHLSNNLCLYCGKPNHKAIDCPAKKGPKRTINVVSTDNKTDEEYVSVECPRTLANVHNTKNIPSLIDSGASATCMDVGFASKNSIPIDATAPSLNILAVDGRPIGKSQSTAMLSASVGNYKFQKTFHLIHSPRNPVIFGQDWLSEHNPDIDWRQGTIKSFRPEPPSFRPASPTKKVSFANALHDNGLLGLESVANSPSVSGVHTHVREGMTANGESSEPVVLASISVGPSDTTWKPTVWQYLNPLAGIKAVSTKDKLIHGIIRVCSILLGSKPTRIHTVAPEVVLPEIYAEFKGVFNKSRAEKLPENRPFNCSIDLVPGSSPPFGPLYNLSEKELVTLKAELDEQL